MEDASSGRLKNLASSAEILQLQCDEFLIRAHFFCKNTIVIRVKIRALRVKYSIFQKRQDLIFFALYPKIFTAKVDLGIPSVLL